MGSHVLVDMTTQALHLRAGTSKVVPSPHRRDDELPQEVPLSGLSSSSFSTSAIVGARLSSPDDTCELAPPAQPSLSERTGVPLRSTRPWRIASASRLESPARLVQQGHRPPRSRTATGEPSWSQNHGDEQQRHEGNVDEHDGLQLRKIHSFAAV